MRQYDRYHFGTKECLLILLKGEAAAVLLAVLFYDFLPAAIPLSALLIVYWRTEREKKKKACLKKLNIQFRDGILAVSAALGAGYSVENAFGEALKDLQYLYGKDEPIMEEFRWIVTNMELNRTPESLLYDFAERCRLEDVQMFADVFGACKRTGGDLQTVIRDTAARIGEKLDAAREIETFLSAKKLEQKIMNLVPVGILLYVRMTSPDFLSGLYGTLPGALVMTVCLLVYGGAYLMAGRLMEIEV